MSSVPSKAEVVIIGGGIVGASIAYHLGKAGVKRVLLLEKGIMGQGSTGKCAGGIRSQFSTRINLQFSQLSLKAFDLFYQELGVDPEFHQTGYLFMAFQEKHLAMFEANKTLMGEMGLNVELLDPDEISRLWPFLRTDDLMGGAYTEKDGYAGPYEVLQGYIKGARRTGATLFEGVEATAIEVDRGRVCAVWTSTGERVKTPLVINAAGPQAASVAAMAGLDLPVTPIRRQVFFTDPFSDLPETFPLVIDLEHGWYMRREGQGILLSGPQDSESSFNEETDFQGREWAAELSVDRVPILEKARIMRGWAGLYEVSPDQHAILGEFPELKGFICANGFSGHGFQHSPATGLLVAELATEGRVRTLDIHSLRPQRFREGDLIHEPLTAVSCTGN
ncbi:NAD(P)/FAD-dependent oxidoreductase [Thermodesulfobacteriota bacterium]